MQDLKKPVLQAFSQEATGGFTPPNEGAKQER